MVVDTSALLAVLFGEDDSALYAGLLAKSGRKMISPFNALEADIVVRARKGSQGQQALERLIYHSLLDVVPFDAAMGTLAFESWMQFGKGRHPASLNMGDCCSYALAVYLGEPLLYKGGDFLKTDVRSVL